TTELVVSKTLLAQHPDIVNDLLKGLLKSVDWIDQNPATAPAAANAALAGITGAKALSSAVLTPAWAHLTFTLDPLAAALQTDASHAQRAGLISSTNLHGIVDAGPLNAILGAAGRPLVSASGLGS